MENLKKKLNDTLQSISDVNTRIGEVGKFVLLVESEVGSNTQLLQSASLGVNNAIALVEDADAAYVSGEILLRQINRAGNTLMTAVDRIGVLVSKAVEQTNPQLSAVPAIIQGLSDTSNIFVPGLNLQDTLTGALEDVEPQGDEKSIYTEMLSQAIANLKSSVLSLASNARHINGIVKSVNDSRPIETLKNCGVNISEVDTDISLSRSNIVFDAAEVAIKRIIVTGGKKPYVAVLLDSPALGLEVRSPIPGDSVIEIIANNNTVAGNTYDVQVTDATMTHTKVIKIQIKKKVTEPPPPPPKQDELSQQWMEIIKGLKFPTVGDDYMEIVSAELTPLEGKPESKQLDIIVKKVGEPIFESEEELALGLLEVISPKAPQGYAVPDIPIVKVDVQ